MNPYLAGLLLGLVLLTAIFVSGRGLGASGAINRYATRVFVDESGEAALRGALLAERLGYDDVRVLRGGLAELRRTILESGEAPPAAVRTAAEVDAQRFHAQVRAELPRLIDEAKGRSDRPKPVVKAVKGGCS
jgi:hypothetical protein